MNDTMQGVEALNAIRNAVRGIIRPIAGIIHHTTRGKVTPNGVTITGMLAHFPIAVLIGLGDYAILAAILLIIFGLFDTLDGELARLQHRTSALGMFLDATTDRIKEVTIYAGIAFLFAGGPHPQLVVWALVACGASLCVSYVKAKGEAAVATSGKKISYNDVNRLFKDGLLTFELRIALLAIGLLFGQLLLAVQIIAVLATFTVVQRLVKIGGTLKHA